MPRLRKEDWIDHGFEVLKTEGHAGLKADRMVRAMNVSRGSFYWHFADIADFHSQLLAAWRERITEAEIADLTALPEGADPLQVLIARVLSRPQQLERAVRLWAGADPAVAEAVEEVDQLRIGYVASRLRALGLSDAIALSRAVFLGDAYTGHALSGRVAEDPDTRARDLAHILIQPEA